MNDQHLGGESPHLPASLWAATAIPAPVTSPLSGDVRTDVAIVGAGFLGLSAALHLAERGTRVVVVDATQPGWGASGRNNGQVIPGLKFDPEDVEAMLGREVGGRLALWAGRAPELVFELIARHGIDCYPVQRGWIQPAYTKAAVPVIEDRARQWRERGVAAVWLPKATLPARLGTPGFHAAWFDPRGGSVQPLSYARGLAQAAQRAGAILHAPTLAGRLEREGAGWTLRTDGGRIQAQNVVVATNAYSSDLLPGLKQSVVPVRTAQVATAPLPPEVRSVILPGGEAASDTRHLLTSFRQSPDGRLVMGGSDATAGAEKPRQAGHLHAAAEELFGHLGPLKWDFFWSGYLAITKDHLPHIYEPQPGLLAGIGCNGRGIAVSTGVGRLIAERILGRAAQDLDVPVVPFAPFALRSLRHVGVSAATRWKRMQDRRERAA